jgi:hypothetical protein
VYDQLPKGAPPPEMFTKESIPLLLGGIGHYDALLKNQKEVAQIEQAKAAQAKAASDQAREERAAVLQAIRPDMPQEEYRAILAANPLGSKGLPAAPGAWVNTAKRELIKESERAKVAMEQRELEGMDQRGIKAVDAARLEQQEAEAAQRAEQARANNAVTMRGQNMTDERAREMAQVARDNKPLTEAENKAYGFFNRMKNSDKYLESAAEAMANKSFAGQAYQKIAPDFMQFEENQSFDTARRQFSEAFLRRDSGAAISPKEYDDISRAYFPQPGNTPAILKQKAEARKVVIDSLAKEAGRAIARYDGDQAKPPGGNSGKVVVTDPAGGKHEFDTQAQADAFKKAAGIK